MNEEDRKEVFAEWFGIITVLSFIALTTVCFVILISRFGFVISFIIMFTLATPAGVLVAILAKILIAIIHTWAKSKK